MNLKACSLTSLKPWIIVNKTAQLKIENEEPDFSSFK